MLWQGQYMHKPCLKLTLTVHLYTRLKAVSDLV